MTTFTREQLAAVVHDRATVIHDGGSFSLNVQDLAAFTLAQVERVEDLERTLSTAIKNHLCEVDKRKQAETISAGNLARAEKAEAERDDANDERDDAVDRWARRAREAEATVKDYFTVQADRDRLRAQLDSILANSDSLESGKLADANAEIARLREENKSLREANEIDLGEKAPLIFENAKLKARNEILREELLGAKVAWDMCDEVNRGLREELRDAEEAVLFADAYIRSELADDYRIVEGDNRVWGEDFTAVCRARERKEKEEQC